tara:strand:- start:2494 stop:6051 length:3558 start_codon:yes stop_codon:yes gene_type:complete
MLTLQVFDSNDDPDVFLDLYEDSPVALNKRFQDVSDVNSAQGSFTQTFRVPATKTNREYFGAYFDANVNGGFDSKRRRKCVLAKAGMVVMEGSLQLLACYVQSGQHHEYELTVYGGTADLATVLRGVQMKDIDWSTYAHQQSESNVQDALNNGIASGTVRYAIVDRGFGWTQQVDFTQSNPGNMVVMLRLDQVVERILGHAGYDLGGSFFASGGEGQEVFMAWTRGGAANEYASQEDYGFQGRLDGDQTLNFTSVGQNLTLQWKDTGIAAEDGFLPTDVYDYGGNYDETAFQYTAPFGGYYQFQVLLNVVTITQDGGVQFVLRDTTDGINADQQLLELFIDGGGDLGTGIRQFTFEANLVEGNVYEFRAQGFPVDASGALPNITLEGDGIFRSKVLLNIGTVNDGNLNFDFDRNAPDMTALDVLRGLQVAFNLLFIPGLNSFEVLPAQSYLYTGDVLDWSKKVDYDKDFVIKPTSDLQSAEYTFTHAESSDILAQSWINTANRTFGRYRILDTENDFASGETELSTGFAPWIESLVNGFEILSLYSDDGSPIREHKPMLAYFAGKRTGFSYAVGFGDGTVNIGTGFPVFSSCNTLDGGVDAKTLNFGFDTANANLSGEPPTRTLYFEYWDQYFSELYSVESRMVECDAFLTPADIASFEWSDDVLLREGRFRVLSIDGYSAMEGTPVRLKLLRRLSDPYVECEYTVASTSAGVVTFEDADGNTSLGNESCCLQYGFYWTGAKCQVTPPATGRFNASSAGSLSTAGSTAGATTVPALIGEIQRLKEKVEHIHSDRDGVTAIVVKDGEEAIKAEDIKETTDRRFVTSAQETAISGNATDLGDLRKKIEGETLDKLGVFSNTTDETKGSVKVTTTSAILRAGDKTAVEATQTSPGLLAFKVQAGASGSEAEVTAVQISGSASLNTKATINFTSGDCRFTNTPVQFNSGSAVAFQGASTFSGSTSGIDYNDLDNTPTTPADLTDLGDTPASLGTAGQVLAVNTGATALEFVDQSGGGASAKVYTFHDAGRRQFSGSQDNYYHVGDSIYGLSDNAKNYALSSYTTGSVVSYLIDDFHINSFVVPADCTSAAIRGSFHTTSSALTEKDVDVYVYKLVPNNTSSANRHTATQILNVSVEMPESTRRVIQWSASASSLSLSAGDYLHVVFKPSGVATTSTHYLYYTHSLTITE